MISVVVCSRKIQLDSHLVSNIKETIGCSHELIVINNSRNRYSIFEAYNVGISRANFSYIVFMHDDILIHSYEWGKDVQEIFEKDNNVGLIGIAGSRLKTKIPSAWWDVPKEFYVINILQHKENTIVRLNRGFESANLVEVATIDGVFMAVRNDSNARFNQSVQGFHNYDLQLSLHFQHLGKKVVVTNKILLEHFSIGTLDKQWAKSLIAVNKKYQKDLPYCKNGGNPPMDIEFRNGTILVKNLLKLNMYYEAFRFWVILGKLNPRISSHLALLKHFLHFFLLGRRLN